MPSDCLECLTVLRRIGLQVGVESVTLSFTMSKHADKGVIGFCSMVSQEIANRRMGGVLHYLQDTPGLRLRDFRVFGDLGTEAEAPPPPWTGKADGVIICFGLSPDETSGQIYRWIARGQAPVVNLTNEWMHPKVPFVCTDIDAMTRLAAEYLVGKGHRHFAFLWEAVALQASSRHHEVFHRRLMDHGYRALRCDLSFRPGESIRTDERLQHESGLIQFLRKAPKPLGVFTMNDHHARAVCVLCDKLGLDVPNEVAVLGAGNLMESRAASPVLSSVETEDHAIGFEAMKLLHQLMKGGRAPRRRRLPPPIRVIDRESTCPGFVRFGDAERARKYIGEHACEGINVADLVRAMSVSRRTLENHFRESVGHSPGEEICLVRLSRAQELLTRTDLSMTAVSGMSGFSEPPRFSEFFRRRVGLTPSEYRRRWKEGV